MDIFADNLPGVPDNIRRSKSGGYWIGFALVRNPNKPAVTNWMARFPFIRRVIAKVRKPEYKGVQMSSSEGNRKPGYRFLE